MGKVGTCRESKDCWEWIGSALSLLRGVSLQVSLTFTIRDKLLFLILALDPLKITHVGSESKKDPVSQNKP